MKKPKKPKYMKITPPPLDPIYAAGDKVTVQQSIPGGSKTIKTTMYVQKIMAGKYVVGKHRNDPAPHVMEYSTLHNMAVENPAFLPACRHGAKRDKDR
jgi:hypothetical protein